MDIDNEIQKSKIEVLLRMCVVFYSSFVCISVYANIYLKTILRECLRAGLPPGFPSTAPPPVCVSAVLGTLVVWIPNQKKNKKQNGGSTLLRRGRQKWERQRSRHAVPADSPQTHQYQLQAPDCGSGVCLPYGRHAVAADHPTLLF